MRFFRSYLLIAVMTILMVTSSTVYAAFPLKPSQTVATNTETVARKTDVDFKTLVNDATERFTQKSETVPDQSGKVDGSFGIGAFFLGLAGFIALVGMIVGAIFFSATISPFLLLLAILGSMGAMILGAVGLDRPQKGFAIAGLLFGIVTLLILNWEFIEYAFSS